ncbi:MAG: ABC transporter permease [Actinomycetota bacterium]
MKVLVIAGTNLKRLFRDRSSIFFIFVFPLALVLLIGLQFGGGFRPQIGVLEAAPGSGSARVVDSLRAEDGLEVVTFPDEEAQISAVETGTIEAAVILPSGFDQAIASGEKVQVGFVAHQSGVGPSLRPVVAEAVRTGLLPVTAARFVADQGLAGFDAALATASRIEPSLERIEVTTRTIGESVFPPTLGRYDLGASSQLILFMFVTALSGGAVLIQTRQLGLSRRMLSTPTPVGTVLGGEALGRFAVVVVQGLYIMIGTWLLFGVNWGSLPGALGLISVFAVVGAGAAMLIGTLFRNAEQAGGVAVMVGLGLAALGGCMFPLQLFPPAMKRIAHFTPHAWALDGFTELVQRGGGLFDILPQLGVLAGFAMTLLALASWRLRVAITTS